ncbi:MAG: beta-ketoacyl-ACP synthase II [Oscillospiraceae bacterium]|nr:beta-ketoacyl-ACP synthase II [Oscillospiraceae bacterium]
MRRVVVTGVGAITPIGLDVPTMWNNMLAGVCGIGRLDRIDAEAYKAKVAAQVRDFDPSPWFDKAEARKTDLYCQFAVAAAEQAIEDSGIKGTMDDERIGVYVGTGIGGMTTLHEQIDIVLNKGPRRVSPHTIPKLIGNIAAGTIAIRNGFHGPTLPMMTACATGTNEIGEAYRAIAHGYADAIVAGGAEAVITPVAVAGFTAAMALSITEDPLDACKPFDARHNGFVMGEGAGIVILEEYEHAKARGAKIYAEMVGYGNTCDAYHVTAPDPKATESARAVRMAWEQAGSPTEHIYVNAHGTSTKMNDSTETQAYKLAFGEELARKLMISSTKSMTGHMLGAAGAVEAIAAILAVRDDVVPPTINYKEPDPACDLDYTPNVKREARVELALSDSMGFGGHNACVAFKKAEE